MAIKKIERKPLSLAEKTYLPQIASGLKITFKNIFRPTITLQYPEERPEIPENYRGVPTLVKDPNGREKCVSCQLCEFVCPPKAIRIVPPGPVADPTATSSAAGPRSAMTRTDTPSSVGTDNWIPSIPSPSTACLASEASPDSWPSISTLYSEKSPCTNFASQCISRIFSSSVS